MIQIIKGFANSLETQARNDAGRYADLLIAEGGTNIRGNGECEEIAAFAVDLYRTMRQRTDFWMFRKRQNMGTGSVAYSFLGKAATLIGPVTWGDDALTIPNNIGVMGVRGPDSLVIPPRINRTQIFVAKRNANENVVCNMQIKDEDTGDLIYHTYVMFFQNNIIQGSWPMGKALFWDSSVVSGTPDFFQNYGMLQQNNEIRLMDRKVIRASRPVTSQLIPANVTAHSVWLASSFAKVGNSSFVLLSERSTTIGDHDLIVERYRETLGKGLPWYE